MTPHLRSTGFGFLPLLFWVLGPVCLAAISGPPIQPEQKPGISCEAPSPFFTLCQKLRDPLQTTLKKVLLEVSHDFSGSTVEDFIVLKYQGHSLSLKVLPIQDAPTQFRMLLEGEALSENDARCWDFKVNLETQTGHLSWINTRTVTCPIPKEKGGTFLLNFTEALAKSMKLKENSLIDVSSVTCDKSGKTAELPFLRLMQKGKTWYEENGYLPPAYQKYRESVEEQRHHPLSDLEHALNEISDDRLTTLLEEQNDFTRTRCLKRYPQLAKPREKWGDVPKTFQSLYLSIPAKVDITPWTARRNHVLTQIKAFHGQENTLSSFIPWLWNKDCSVYVELDELMTSDLGLLPNIGMKKIQAHDGWHKVLKKPDL